MVPSRTVSPHKKRDSTEFVESLALVRNQDADAAADAASLA